ncbi:MAG: FtsX-like permease family protein [Candidatus Melainabacteria bacterium]|nr:FtsX-like permease family protein [Candidatus Melainabacteria bacterium]
MLFNGDDTLSVFRISSLIAGFRLFRQCNLRDLYRNRLRTTLTILGIALGVAVLLAIHLSSRAAVVHFEDSLVRVAGKSNLEIVSETGQPLSEAILPQLSWLWQVPSHYSPVLESTVAIQQGKHPPNRPAESSPDSESLSATLVPLLAVNMLADRQGQDREDQSSPWAPGGEPTNLWDIFKPAHAYVGQQLARQQGLKRGQKMVVWANERAVSLTISGILSDEGLGGAYSGALVLMDMGPAQALLHMPGQLSRISLQVPEDQLESLQEKIQAQLPASWVVQRPERRGQQVGQLLRAYQLNLMALSFIALLVGAFLIYNTLSITVIRRRSEIGILRALGLLRWQVAALYLMEALWVGTLGSLLGLALGWWMAQGTLGAVSQTVQQLYTGQPVGHLRVEWTDFAWAFAWGMGFTLLAAICPVWEAATVAPAEASRRGSDESRLHRLSVRLSLLGVALGLLALWASIQPPVSDFPLFGFLAAFLLLLAAAACTPLLLQALLPPLSRLLSHYRGAQQGLATRMLFGALGRTSVAVASLAISVSMLVSLTVMIGSFRETVVQWVHQTLQADLFIQPAIRSLSRNTGFLHPATLSLVRQTPGVRAVDAFIERPIRFQGQQTYLGAGDFEVLGQYGRLPLLSGEPLSRLMQREQPKMEAKGWVPTLVSESFALRFGVKAGQCIEIKSPTGLLTLGIMGIYTDFSSEQGYLVIPRSVYAKRFKDDSLSSLAVFLHPSADSQQVRQQFMRRLPRQSRLSIQTNRALRAEVLRIFDQTFAVTYAMQGVAIAVAVLAILNTLLALVLEHRRDLGLLKYLGASQKTIRQMVLTQALTLGTLGTALGWGVGWLLAILLIQVINRQSFHWSIQWHWPWPSLLLATGLLLLTAWLGGLLPARMAGKTMATEALRAE